MYMKIHQNILKGKMEKKYYLVEISFCFPCQYMNKIFKIRKPKTTTIAFFVIFISYISLNNFVHQLNKK